MQILSFDEAYERLLSTIPGALIESYEIHESRDRHGFQLSEHSATVICYEPRLTNAVRQVGNWYFLIDNRFIGDAVHKIATLWILHDGGRRFGDLELLRALRHCFKRFYAESLIAAGNAPLGRTMLIESLAFERAYTDALQLPNADPSDEDARRFWTSVHELANPALGICEMHELGHVMVRRSGQPLDDLCRAHLDELGVSSIAPLLAWRPEVAEEVYCDIFAIDYLLQVDIGLSHAASARDGNATDPIRSDSARRALFSYHVLMTLSELWLSAVEDAAEGWDPAEASGERHLGQPSIQREFCRVRLGVVSKLLARFVEARGGRLHASDGRFQLSDRFADLIVLAAQNLGSTADADEIASVSLADREVARFLGVPMPWSEWVGQYLVSARDREYLSWTQLADEPAADGLEDVRVLSAELDALLAESDAQQSILDAPGDQCGPLADSGGRGDTGDPAVTGAAIASAIGEAFAEYTDIFDRIMEAIVGGAAMPAEVTFKLNDLADDVRAKLAAYEAGDFASVELTAFARGTAVHYMLKLSELHITALTILRLNLDPSCGLAHVATIEARLTMLEEHAARQPKQSIGAFAALILPELGASYSRSASSVSVPPRPRPA